MSAYVDARQSTRRRRRTRRWVIAVLVVVVLLVGADFVAKTVAQHVVAAQVQKQAKLPSEPGVTIEGFPFLVQVAAKDINHVQVEISNLKEGPVTFSSINADATNVRLKSYAFNSGTIGHIKGTALISFSSLGNTLTAEFGPLGDLLNGVGLNLSDAGPNEVKANVSLVGSATWRITRVDAHTLNAKLIASSGLLRQLNSVGSKTFTIPPLPLGLTLDSLAVTPSGIVGIIGSSNAPFGS